MRDEDGPLFVEMTTPIAQRIKESVSTTFRQLKFDSQYKTTNKISNLARRLRADFEKAWKFSVIF